MSSYIQKKHFSLAQYWEIIRVYGEINFDQESIFHLISDKIINRIPEMTEDDLVNATIGFLGSAHGQKFKIVSKLQQQLLKIVSKISLSNATTILLKYASFKYGERPVVQGVLYRVYDLTLTLKEISPFDLYMIISAYDALGVSDEYYLPILNKIIDSIKFFDFERLQELYKILYKRNEDENFNKAFIAVKNEIDKYDNKGVLKRKFY